MGMVDISEKQITKRTAMAEGIIIFSPKAFKIFLTQGSPKGDVLQTARIAGIMAVKNTPLLIPLCHPLAIEKVMINFQIIKSTKSIKVSAEVNSTGKTGVEMEALSAVMAACLCIYDMMKFAGQGMTITSVLLTHKSGGKSGVYQR